MKDDGDALARLDVTRLAEAGAEFDGVWPGAGFKRLGEGTLGPPADVRWSIRGERRGATRDETWMHLTCSSAVELTCQRCLQALTQALQVRRSIRFVRDEAEAERLDEEFDDDVLALRSTGLDLQALVEDELILAMPIVARHETCPQPLPPFAAQDIEPAPNPFAVLAALKKSSSTGGQ